MRGLALPSSLPTSPRVCGAQVAHLLFEPVIKPFARLASCVESWKRATRKVEVDLQVVGSEGLGMNDLIERAGLK